MIGQLPLNFLPAQLRVAPGAQQAGLGGQQGALAVHMDGTALQHKIPGVVAVKPQLAAQGGRHGVVLVPAGVQAVHFAAPGIEFPADAPQRPAVRHKGGADVPRPGVVALDLKHRHAGDARRGGLGGGKVGGAGQQVNVLAFCDLPDHVQESLLRSGRVPPPAAGAHRPDQHGGPVGGKLGGHGKAVRRGQGREQRHHESLPLKSS